MIAHMLYRVFRGPVSARSVDLQDDNARNATLRNVGLGDTSLRSAGSQDIGSRNASPQDISSRNTSLQATSLQSANLRALAFLGACFLCAALFVCSLAGFPRAALAETEHKNTINVNQLADSSFLYDTSIASLATADSFQDAQIVQIRGEVVGDRINDESRSDSCWITLAEEEVENPAVISVLMTNEQASAIDTFGNYSKRGTILQVRGTYYLNCSEHQGLSDIHTDEVSVVAQGEPIEHEVNPAILTAAFFSILIGLGLLFFYSWRRERMR